MVYIEFLTQVIEDGLKSVGSDESLARHPKQLEGARAGFEACRDKLPEQLAELLAEANRKSALAYSMANDKDADIEEYWKQQYYTLQVEWVCNTVSAMLMSQGAPMITTVTARGVMNAARILGVSGAEA